MRIIMTIALLVITIPVSAADHDATELRMITSWGENHSGTKHIAYRYRDMVRDMSGGSISITAFGPEVVPPGRQLQPAGAGVFDLIYTHGLYHTGDTAIGAALDAVDKDIEKRRSSGLWAWIDGYYSRTQNLKVLAIPTAQSGFRLLLRKPMPDNGKLTGMKIRALPSWNGVVQNLDAVPVVISFGELYSSVEKGVVDGLIWTGVGILNFKFHEVAPHLMDPVFGSVSYLLMMNLDKWNGLGPAQQELLLEAGLQLERSTVTTFNRMLVEETAAMEAAGAKRGAFVELSQEKLNTLFADKAMALAIEYSGQDGVVFRDLVRDKGL
jgi:TRAP-type transport system periplasmic protein